MKIAFFGSSLVSSYWNGAATYYRGLLKALAAFGHDITFYEPDAFERQQHRDIADPPWARVVVYPATLDGCHSALDEAACSADLIAKASGIGVFDEELATAIPDLAGPRRIIVYWDVDAPATLQSMTQDPRHHLRAVIPHYDCVFTYGGASPVVSRYLAFGARRCIPIYNALDPSTHFPVLACPEFRCDLGFLGNRLPDREPRVEEFLLRPARLLPDCEFLLGGAGWDDKRLPSNVRCIGHVGTVRHNAFFCSGLATLNINRKSMAEFGYSPPTRIFEAAGATACIITDAWAGIEQFLEPGREILVAQNGDAVAAILRRLSNGDAARIGAAARARVLSEHTYAHRAREVIRVLDMMTHSEAA
ncbi:MAG TPA: glycosyltransferase [Xanthobacteraceae bacterium]|nr:glycosyltransferase [Xanthobacteraceae bacterium]